MKNTVTVQDQYNPLKTVQFKESNCSHFYQRQLIGGKAITNWQRIRKQQMIDCFGRFYKGLIKLV